MNALTTKRFYNSQLWYLIRRGNGHVCDVMRVEFIAELCAQCAAVEYGFYGRPLTTWRTRIYGGEYLNGRFAIIHIRCGLHCERIIIFYFQRGTTSSEVTRVTHIPGKQVQVEHFGRYLHINDAPIQYWRRNGDTRANTIVIYLATSTTNSSSPITHTSYCIHNACSVLTTKHSHVFHLSSARSENEEENDGKKWPTRNERSYGNNARTTHTHAHARKRRPNEMRTEQKNNKIEHGTLLHCIHSSQSATNEIGHNSRRSNNNNNTVYRWNKCTILKKPHTKYKQNFGKNG